MLCLFDDEKYSEYSELWHDAQDGPMMDRVKVIAILHKAVRQLEPYPRDDIVPPDRVFCLQRLRILLRLQIKDPRFAITYRDLDNMLLDIVIRYNTVYEYDDQLPESWMHLLAGRNWHVATLAVEQAGWKVQCWGSFANPRRVLELGNATNGDSTMSLPSRKGSNGTSSAVISSRSVNLSHRIDTLQEE